jgi:hypothetical protein
MVDTQTTRPKQAEFHPGSGLPFCIWPPQLPCAASALTVLCRTFVAGMYAAKVDQLSQVRGSRRWTFLHFFLRQVSQVMKRTRRQMSDEEVRQLNDEYGILFKGPVPASSWPKDYRDLFANVRAIGRKYYDEYGENATEERAAVTEKKAQVQEVVEAAYQCRRERLNEEGWIREIEPRIVRRFGSEVIW